MKNIASIICILATASLASAAPTPQANGLAGLLGGMFNAVAGQAGARTGGQAAGQAGQAAAGQAAQPAAGGQADANIGKSANGLASSIMTGNGAQIAESALQLASSIVGQTGNSIGLAA